MEEKKKVFVRGRKGREKEVVDILTGLGATPAECSCDDQYIYFINHKNEITLALIDTEIARVIMDNYREIELPRQQWKDGDILVYNSNPKCYAVFKRYNDDDAFFDAYYVIYEKEVCFYATEHVEFYHLANKEESEEANRACVAMLKCIIRSDRKLATQVAQSRV